MVRRRKSKKREYWEDFRKGSLLNEAITKSEIDLFVNVKISSDPVRKLRRERRRMVRRAMDGGLSRSDAIDRVKSTIRGTDDEILTWSDFRRIIYPKKENSPFASW